MDFIVALMAKFEGMFAATLLEKLAESSPLLKAGFPD